MNRIFKTAAEHLEKAAQAFGMAAEKRLMELADNIVKTRSIPTAIRKKAEENLFTLAQAFNRTDICLDRGDVLSLLRGPDQKYKNNPGIHAATKLWELNEFLSDYCKEAGYGQRFCAPMENMIQRIAASDRLHVSNDILLKIPRPVFNEIIDNIDVVFDLEIADLKSIMSLALSGKSYNQRLSEEVMCLHTGLTEMARKFGVGPYADPDYKDRLEKYFDEITLPPREQKALDKVMDHLRKRGLE